MVEKEKKNKYKKSCNYRQYNFTLFVNSMDKMSRRNAIAVEQSLDTLLAGK